MSLNVGSVNAYAPNFQSRGIDPRKDKVYIDPQTGERTTWKPGIFDPEAQQRNADRRAKVATGLLGLSAIAAAIVFRKPIGKAVVAGAKKVAEFAKPVIEKGAELVRPVVNKVSEFVRPVIDKVVKFFTKAPTAAV